MFRPGYDDAVSSPGWYADPAAEPGSPRWRWWDGERWTSAGRTGDTAPTVPPADPGGPGPRPPSTVRPAVPYLAAVAVMLVAGVLLAFVPVRPARTTWVPPRGDVAATDATTGPSAPDSPCPVGVSGYRNEHPVDNSSYGGRLVLPKSAVPYTRGPDGGVPVLASLEDTETWFEVWTQGKRRQSGITLGELRRSGGYATVQEAARRAVDCMVAMPVRRLDVTAVATVTDEALTVGGRPAWKTSVDVTLAPAKQAGVTGERLTVVVVDDGRDAWLSALATTARLDQPALAAEVDRVPSALRLVG